MRCIPRPGQSPESRLHISGGLSGDLAIERAGNALSVKGRLHVGDATIENPGAKVAVRGIKADVPVNYVNEPALETIGAAGREEPSENGVVPVQEIKTPFLLFPPIDLSLHSLPNAYRIDAFCSGYLRRPPRVRGDGPGARTADGRFPRRHVAQVDRP